MQLKTIKDINIRHKRILMRADYNVSIQGKTIADDTRIRHTLPTIKYLLENGATVTLMAHLGRPKSPDPKYSLEPVALYLQQALGTPVSFYRSVSQCRTDTHSKLKLLENLRFFPGETTNDPIFSQELASLGDIYVDDAFGAAHRTHASIVGVARLLPAVAGLSFVKEVTTILDAVNHPARPLVVIVGGAKISDKIQMLNKLIETADTIIIGGGMANTFLSASGYSMGQSYYEVSATAVAKRLLAQAKQRHKTILLPQDVIIGNLSTDQHNGPVPVTQIPSDMQALDIGPRSQVEFGRAIASAGTVIWNGPMGVFEKPEFATGTEFIFHALTKNTKAFVVVGGGDTLKAIKKQQHIERIDHVSTGGGAMLELIENGTLPGIDVLQTLS